MTGDNRIALCPVDTVVILMERIDADPFEGAID
jgi:hypothetical protein